MFAVKVCCEQIDEVYNEFTKKGLNATIQSNFIIEIDEPNEQENNIRRIIKDKNLPVFIDTV